MHNHSLNSNEWKIPRTHKHYSQCRPLVSIITPTLNAAGQLEAAIKSVRSQNYDNIEYLIIDGGSSDGTIDIICDNSDIVDYWISENDKGIYDAMNKGIRQARGSFFYFMGSDDLFVNCLHKVAPRLRSQQTIYYGDVYMVTKNKVYDGRFSAEKLAIKNICHQAIFYPRQVFEHLEFDLRYPVLADWALNLQCWNKFRFKYLPILISIFNDRGASGATKDLHFTQDKDALVRHHLGSILSINEEDRIDNRLVEEVWIAEHSSYKILLRAVDRLESVMKFIQPLMQRFHKAFPRTYEAVARPYRRYVLSRITRRRT